MSDARQTGIVLSLLVPLLVTTGVLFPSAAAPLVFLVVILLGFLVRDTRTDRDDGSIVADSSNFITRTVEDYLVKQHERHYGPGTSRLSRFPAAKHKPMPDALRIVVYTTCLTTAYLSTHLAIAGAIDASVHRLLLPALKPASGPAPPGGLEGAIWGIVLGGPIAAGLGLTLAQAARAGSRPKLAWPDLRLPVFLILLGAGYAALAAATIARHLTRSPASPDGDTLLIILLAHAAAAAAILPGIFVLGMLTVSRRFRATQS